MNCPSLGIFTLIGSCCCGCSSGFFGADAGSFSFISSKSPYSFSCSDTFFVREGSLKNYVKWGMHLWVVHKICYVLISRNLSLINFREFCSN